MSVSPSETRLRRSSIWGHRPEHGTVEVVVLRPWLCGPPAGQVDEGPHPIMREPRERQLVAGYKPEAQLKGQQRAAEGLLAPIGLELPELTPQ